MRADSVFFTSDHHFGHANIIKYADRPFSSVEEMDAELIRRWNDTVREGNDIVYHLGDFTLSGDLDRVREIMAQLNGQISILYQPFHHDKRWIKGQPLIPTRHGFLSYLPPIEVIEFDSLPPITISHYPLMEWQASYHGGLHFHGHSHGNSPARPNAWDVGVDVWGFVPVSIKDIIGE